MAETAHWSIYNFDTNWDTFFSVWKCDDVQDTLKAGIDDLMHLRARRASLQAPAECWNIGDPIWHLSRSSHHDSEMLKKAEQYIRDKNIFNIYKKRMREISNKIFANDDQAYEHFTSTCLASIKDTFKPKTGTLDSLILVGGKEYINDAIYKCASNIFPGEELIMNMDTVIVPERKIVFDLYGFYWAKINGFVSENGSGNPTLQSDEYYDLVVQHCA